MNTKVINCLVFLFCFFVCEFTESKTVRAKNHIDALYKMQKKEYDYFYKSEIEDRNYHRKHFLLGREEWDFFGSREDTIYVCECVHLNSSSRDEYIISSKLIYATHSRWRSLSWKIYSLEENIFPCYFVEEKNIPDIRNISITIRDSRYIPKTIAVQVLGGYYFTCFHLSGSKSRYCSIGVFGGHAAHLSIMSQK